MGIQHTKNVMRVAYRANIPVFLFGAHGIGKTSAAYQMYQEAAEEHGLTAVSEEIVIESAVASGLMTREEAEEAGIDAKSLSSLDGRHLARAGEDLDRLGFWSMSGPNLTLEELVGMPHVDNRGALYRDTYMRAQDTAATLMAKDFSGDLAHLERMEEITEAIFRRNCARLGITEDDRNHLVLRYMRMYGIMPDPRHRGGGVWLIDEPNRAFQEVEKALMQILLERRYLDYIVPDGVWICMTMNPPGGDYQVREMDMATLDRGLLMTVSSEKDEFIEWASRRGLSEGSRVFVDRHSGLLNKYEQSIDLTMIDNPGTFRSVEYADRAFRVMDEREIATVGQSIATGLLGQDAGHNYFQTYTDKTHRALTSDDVMLRYGWREDMEYEEEADYAQWKETPERRRLKKMVRSANVKSELVRYTLDEIKKTVEDMHTSLKERGGTKSNPKMTRDEQGQVLNMLLFLNDIPVDIARSFVRDDLKDVFALAVRWTGVKYPVARALQDRVVNQYKEREREDEQLLAATGT